mmetsp:Transcript_33367/g.71090  ORF Transcript_33367/g.71090 Transcript_33367/m.71090 type:complete len:320 (-) Transcript_33367:562-1521(-)
MHIQVQLNFHHILIPRGKFGIARNVHQLAIARTCSDLNSSSPKRRRHRGEVKDIRALHQRIGPPGQLDGIHQRLEVLGVHLGLEAAAVLVEVVPDLQSRARDAKVSVHVVGGVAGDGIEKVGVSSGPQDVLGVVRHLPAQCFKGIVVGRCDVIVPPGIVCQSARGMDIHEHSSNVLSIRGVHLRDGIALPLPLGKQSLGVIDHCLHLRLALRLGPVIIRGARIVAGTLEGQISPPPVIVAIEVHPERLGRAGVVAAGVDVLPPQRESVDPIAVRAHVIIQGLGLDPPVGVDVGDDVDLGGVEDPRDVRVHAVALGEALG